MKIQFHVYVLTDCNGDTSYDVVSDLCNNVCLHGYDAEGKYRQYDSYEGFHAYSWAETYGFKLQYFKREIEI